MGIKIPDNWIVLKINYEEEPAFYKVLAGWSGGYLDGDTWMLNSGITEVREEDMYYDFIGESGSIYRCNKNSETIRMNIAGILNQLLEKHPDKIKQVPASSIQL